MGTNFERLLHTLQSLTASDWAAWVQAIGTVIAVAASGGIAWWQLREARAIERWASRPYLNLVNVNHTWVWRGGSLMEVRATAVLSNNGRTPAVRVKTRCAATEVTRGFSPSFDLLDQDPADAVIGPNCEAHAAPISIPAEKLTGAYGNHIDIYLVLDTSYADLLGAKYHTRAIRQLVVNLPPGGYVKDAVPDTAVSWKSTPNGDRVS